MKNNDVVLKNLNHKINRKGAIEENYSFGMLDKKGGIKNV